MYALKKWAALVGLCLVLGGCATVRDMMPSWPRNWSLVPKNFSLWPFSKKAAPAAEEAPLQAAPGEASIEVARPAQDPGQMAKVLEERLQRRGFNVGRASGSAPMETRSQPRSWESETQDRLSAWNFHFVPLYSGPDARRIAGVMQADYRQPRRVRLHFDYDLVPQRDDTVQRFHATLIDVDAGTAIGSMSFSGRRSLDSIAAEAASLVPRSLR